MPISKSRYTRGIILTPDDIGVESIEGELKVALTAAKFQVYLGGALRNIVTENGTATLTNKTIDANGTGNSITNLETADLAAGVLNTNLATPTPTNVQVPSALAAKTYADSVAASGDATVQANLTAHISNPTGAHSASAITNVPAGNLAATDVQGALNELQTDVDTRATSAALTAHISNASGAHAASAISNTPSGNLAATTVQGALNELQTDVDTRVAGPASATDEAVARFDSTTGKLVQNSVVTVSDTGAVNGVTTLSASSIITGLGLTATQQYRDGVASNAQTGSNVLLTTITAPVIVLTGSTLVSVSAIDAVASGFNLTLINRTGNAITIVNEDTSKTANMRIITGTKADLTLNDQASILLKYDAVNSRFSVIGGSGAGGGSSLDTIFQLTGIDAAQWSTGNNATFLGGGTFAGTFAANTTSPLQSINDYKYTQAAGSLNDYACSPAQPVDVRFRGQNVTLFMPMLYNGLSTDIEWLFYDVTNSALIPTSVFIPLQTGTSTIFKTNIVIPLTCASIRVGFQVRTLNSGKVFEFDSVQMTSDSTVYASIANQVQSSFVNVTGSFTSGTNILGAASSVYGSGAYSYNSATGLYTVLKTSPFVISASMAPAAASVLQAVILSGGVNLGIGANDAASSQTNASTSFSGVLQSGATFSVQAAGGTAAAARVSVIATASNDNILTAPDTFSTDTAPLTYASSATYTLATLANAPVGTFITYTYAINTNTRTQTTTAPTQTTADMNANGMLVYTRAYNAASIAAQPSTIAIQIGKGLKGTSLNLYKSAGKVLSGSIDYVQNATTNQEGINQKNYNESTGVLYIDAGMNTTTTTTNGSIRFEDGSNQASGYITINASKNPALTGLNISAVAARGVNSSAQAIGASVTALLYDAAKTFDTHGALNAATGVFTAPETGYYQVSAAITANAVTHTLGDQIIIIGLKNGVEQSRGSSFMVAGSYRGSVRYDDVVFLTRNSTFSLNIYQDGTSTSLVNSGAYNYLSIVKVSIG